jgi:hypothetical protein
MAAAAGSAPAPVGFKGLRASVTPRRSENGRRPRGRTVLLLRVMQACSLAHSPTKSRRMDLHHRCPGGGAFTARCIAVVRPAARRAPAGLPPRLRSGLRHLRAAALRLPRLGNWICHGDVRPAVPDTNGMRRSLRFGRTKWRRRRGGNARPWSGCRLIPSPFLSPPGRLREWGFLSELHRPHAAYDTAASAARPRNRKMWTAPDVRRVLPIKSRVHRCLCLRSERCGRRDLHAHAKDDSEF